MNTKKFTAMFMAIIMIFSIMVVTPAKVNATQTIDVGSKVKLTQDAVDSEGEGFNALFRLLTFTVTRTYTAFDGTEMAHIEDIFSVEYMTDIANGIIRIIEISGTKFSLGFLKDFLPESVLTVLELLSGSDMEDDEISYDTLRTIVSTLIKFWGSTTLEYDVALEYLIPEAEANSIAGDDEEVGIISTIVGEENCIIETGAKVRIKKNAFDYLTSSEISSFMNFLTFKVVSEKNNTALVECVIDLATIKSIVAIVWDALEDLGITFLKINATVELFNFSIGPFEINLDDYKDSVYKLMDKYGSTSIYKFQYEVDKSDLLLIQLPKKEINNPSSDVISKPELISGDISNDKKIRMDDVTTLQKYIASIISLSSDQLYIADVDDNGEVNMSDVTCLQRYLANLITSLPAK